MVKYVLYISVIAIVLVSCKKPEDRKCFKSAGDMSSWDTVLTNFDTLRLFDDIAYELIPDTIYKMEIVGGENLINHIGIQNEMNTLTVTNENKCKFLRNIDKKVKVNIHGPEFNYIHYEGSEELKSLDTLHADELRLFIRDGVGEVDLIVQNGYMGATITHGWGSFKLRGRSLYTYLSCNTNSRCDTRGLQSENVLGVYSNTQGDMFVNADQVGQLNCSINQKGNIYYSGTPNSTNFTINDQGDIIPLD